MEVKSEFQLIVELIQSADLQKCDKNQLLTIINLFDLLKIPMKGQ